MTIELIIAIVGLILGAIGTGYGLTSARKDKVQTILAILNELEEQYIKLREKHAELEQKYAELEKEYKHLLEENRELRTAMRSAGIEFPESRARGEFL